MHWGFPKEARKRHGFARREETQGSGWWDTQTPSSRVMAVHPANPGGFRPSQRSGWRDPGPQAGTKPGPWEAEPGACS